jgi:hypothetical protein
MLGFTDEANEVQGGKRHDSIHHDRMKLCIAVRNEDHYILTGGTWDLSALAKRSAVRKFHSRSIFVHLPLDARRVGVADVSLSLLKLFRSKLEATLVKVSVQKKTDERLKCRVR